MSSSKQREAALLQSKIASRAKNSRKLRALTIIEVNRGVSKLRDLHVLQRDTRVVRG
jgi:hypothetical protein